MTTQAQFGYYGGGKMSGVVVMVQIVKSRPIEEV